MVCGSGFQAILTVQAGARVVGHTLLKWNITVTSANHIMGEGHAQFPDTSISIYYSRITILLIPFRLVIFSIQLEERDRTLRQIKELTVLVHTRMKTSTHSQQTSVERAASIFSIGGICMYSLTVFASFGSSPDFSAWIHYNKQHNIA